MKKILIFLIILFILLIFPFLKEKPVIQQLAFQNKEISKINYLNPTLDLTIPVNYNLEISQTFSFTNDQPDQQKEETTLFNFGQCQSFAETPDALFNRFKKQSAGKSKEKNNLYQMDCGIIQTSFPLSF